MTRTTIQISNPRDLPQLMAPLAFLLACDKVPQAGFEPDTGLTLELIVLKKRKGASPTWWRSCNRWGSWPRRWSPREDGSHLSGRENWLVGRKTWKRKKVGRKSDWEPSALDPVLDHEELANDEDDPGQVEDGGSIITIIIIKTTSARDRWRAPPRRRTTRGQGSSRGGLSSQTGCGCSCKSGSRSV